MPPEGVNGQSPIKLYSDGSSEGLPSPDVLRAALFSEQSLSQPKTPSKSSFAHANVIILDDTPPSPKGKRISSFSTLQCQSNTPLCNSQNLINESLTSSVVNPQPRSLSKILESIAENEDSTVAEDKSGNKRKGKRKLEANDNRASQKELKEQIRLEKKREREMAKAKKEAEKKKQKELKQANALRSASKDTLHDTILCLEKSLHESELGKAIQTQFMGKAAEIVEIEDAFQYTIRWQTKTRAEWDTLSQSYIPFENEKISIIKNKHVAVWMNMQRFTTMIECGDLIPFLTGIKAQQAGSQVVLIIEGLQKYYRDQKNHRSRVFQNSVLKSIAEEFGEQRSRPSTSKKPRTSKTDWMVDAPDKNTIEDIMLSLQLREKIMIVHTANITETASWIASFSATMATTNASSELLDFYMDVRAKSGTDSTDTWLKMLQNIQKCTDAVAKAIVQDYPTVYSLYDAYSKTQSIEEAEMLLADIEVQRSVITNRDRYVNKAMSKKIYSILMSDDNKLVIS